MSDFIAKQDEAIIKWAEAASELAAAKEKESRCRKDLLNISFAFDVDEGNDTREGTENIPLGKGYKLKAVFKLNRYLNNKDEAVDKALSKIEKLGAEGMFISERLVKWKPEISLTEYKNCPEKIKKIIDEVMTSKPALPSVELVAPKGK